MWVEKEALGNVIEKACYPYGVPHMACKGYLSASEAYRAGKRMKRALHRGQQPIMIHLGDHDPSGLDMTRDNEDRLQMFSESYNVDVRRIALNMNQIDQYAPPPNPAKVTDSRAKEYIRKHGRVSWELDALEPNVLVNLIRDELGKLVDDDKWDKVRDAEREKQKVLKSLSDKWPTIRRMLEDEEI